jgi:hypothetical protein
MGFGPAITRPVVSRSAAAGRITKQLLPLTCPKSDPVQRESPENPCEPPSHCLCGPGAFSLISSNSDS